MRRILLYFFIVTGLLVFNTSCNDDFFDTVPSDRLTLDQTFSEESLSENFLANVYSYVPDEFSQRFLNGTSGQWTGGSSEAEYVWSFVACQNINNGSVDASSTIVSQYWTEYYRAINKASIFISKIDNNDQMAKAQRDIRKAEARALRAYYYFNLVKLYGPVIILGDEAIAADASFDEVQLARNSVDECIDFISSQLLEAAGNLPDYPSNTDDFSRITRPIALAFHSQLMLYAASPLLNGNPFYAGLQNEDGKLLFPQAYDDSKWTSAYEASKEFLDTYVPNTYALSKLNSNGQSYTGTDGELYDPYLSYREVVRGEDLSNPEIVFIRLGCNASLFQYELTPFHSGAPSNDYKGSGGKSATQEIADMYFTENGLRIQDDAAFVSTGTSTGAYKDPSISSRTFAPVNTFNEWVGREPRFYADITFNNSIWLLSTPQQIITTTYYSGNSGKSVGGNDYPVTGYIVRKGAPLGSWNSGGRGCVLIRLAEIYLNHAEAANECGHYDEAIEYVNLIRNRAGIPEYGTGTDDNGFERIAYSNDKDEIRNYIRRERTIELAFENHRFFDVRRWLVADMATGDGWVYPEYHEGGEGGDYHGMNINQDPFNFFDKIVFEKRTFEKKHYLFPIPQNEINIDKNLVQTTGWETN